MLPSSIDVNYRQSTKQYFENGSKQTFKKIRYKKLYS